MTRNTKLKIGFMVASVISSMVAPTLLFKLVMFLWGFELIDDHVGGVVFASICAGGFLCIIVLILIDENWDN